jgi:hypothetical protein
MPSVFDRMNELAFGAELTVMAQEVSYRSVGCGVFAVRGEFFSAYEKIEIRDGFEYSSVHPMLKVRLSDFAQPPQQGDRPIIAGVEYEVIDPQSDGHGGADLILRKVLTA